MSTELHSASPSEPTLAGPHSQWVVRLGQVFAPNSSRLFADVGATQVSALSDELFLLRLAAPTDLSLHALACFFRWHFPVQHQWPTSPSKTDGFVEKAARGLWTRFGASSPQNVFVASVHSQPSARALASNVRGRTLQVFGLRGAPPNAAESAPDAPIVLSLVGSTGILAGLTSPRHAKSVHPSGTRFLKQEEGTDVSRAGNKVVDGLELLALESCRVPPGAHWLELGASPGGMTQALLERGYLVTALDRSPLSERISNHPALTFLQQDVALYKPNPGQLFDALLCDMNGDWQTAISQVLRLISALRPGSPILFTLKFNTLTIPEGVLGALHRLNALCAQSGCLPLLVSHTTSNRSELTFVAKKTFDNP